MGRPSNHFEQPLAHSLNRTPASVTTQAHHLASLVRVCARTFNTKTNGRMENGASATEGKDPSSFLGQIIGNPVTVKLNSGVVYKGKLTKTLPYLLLHSD